MRRLSVVFIIPACVIASLVLLLALFNTAPVDAFPALADVPAPETIGAAAADTPISALAESEARTANPSDVKRLTLAETRMAALAPNAPAATLEVEVNYAWDWVAGVTDPQEPGVTVVVTVTNGAGDLKADAEVTAETSGDFFVGCNDWWAGECPDIVPGDIVLVYAEGLVNEINPVGAIPGELNAANNTVTGWLHADWFADPLNVSCEVWEDPGPSPIYTTATTNGGEFQCDFTGSWDLEPFQTVVVRYYEPDGDQVVNILQWPWVQVNYGHDWVGATYYVGHTFWLTVTNDVGSVKATGMAETMPNGGWGGDGFQTQDWQWDPEQPDIIPGDYVYYRADDGYTNEVEVGDINATLDVSADTVGGTILAPSILAQFGISLTVECHPWGAWDTGMGWVPAKQDLVYPDGVDPFLCDWGSGGEWDILPGQDIGVIYTEPDGDNVINVVREPAAYLRINKWSDGQPAEGGNFLYHIYYNNDGDAPAENVQIVDNMIGGVYLSDTSGLSQTGGGGGPITWDIGTLNPGEGGGFDLFVEVTATAGELITNAAELVTTSYTQGEEWERWGYAENEVLPNDTHLNVGKSAWTGDPAPGEDFVYAVNVCNNGNTDSTEVTLEDNLQQPVLVLQDWWAQHPGWYEVSSSPGQLIVANPSIASYTCSEVYLRVLLDSGASPGDYLSNQALISAGNDIETDDNEAWWEGNANDPHSNLQINKWWNRGELYPGGELYYGIGYNNNGNVAVGPILITDTFPAGTSFVSAWHSDPFGGYDFPPTILTPDYAVWELPNLDNGFGGDFEVTLAVDPSATPGAESVNWAEISRLPGEDTHEDNEDSWIEYLNIPGPNLRVTKYYDWQDEQWLNYQIHFENIGDETISDVWVTDELLDGQEWGGWWDMDFDWSRLIGDNQSATTLSWQFSELYPGESGWLYFNATVPDPGVPFRWYTNTVQITTPPLDVNPDDNGDDTLAFSGPELRRVEFWVNPFGDSSMWGEAAPGLVVTVTNPFGTQFTAWADPDCGGCWNVDNVGPLIPGDNVVVEAGDGLQPVVATIPYMDVNVDTAADEVFGQIVPWENRPIEIHGSWPDGFREVPSDGAGNFLATYPDIPPRGSGYVRFIDEIDMAEVIYHQPFYALDLALDVNYGHDWIEGYYEPGHTIWITVTESDGSTVKGVAEMTSDYPPDWEQPGFATWWTGWLGDQPSLMPGDWVYVRADNGDTNSVRIGEIDFDVDYGADLVSGVLHAPWVPDPLVYVECQIWSEGGGPNIGDMVDPDGGAIYCDYGAIPWDIQAGETVAVSYWDDDGDRIINTADWPQITVNIGPWSGGDRQVWGSGATPNSSVDVVVSDEFGTFLEGTTAPTNEWGSFDTGEALSEGILAFWNIVEVNFGNGITDTVTVYPMGGEANPDTDVVTITAAGPPFFSVQLEVCNHQQGWCDWYDLGNIGDSGTIEVDMMADFGFDVMWGQTFYAHMYVWRGHEVRYVWGLPAPELAVSKWHAGNYARPGGVIVYGIEYRNDGNGPAEDVTLVDTLPAFLDYADDTSGLPVSIGAGNIMTWHVGTVEVGEQRSFMVTFNVDSGAPTGPGLVDDNCVTIQTPTEGDWNPDNNWRCAGPVDLWDDEVEVGIDKWIHPQDPTPGQEFEYEIQWCNNRGAAAGPAVLTDTLPSGATLLYWYPEDWGQLFWQEVSLAPDELVLYAPGLPGDSCESIYLRLFLEPEVPISTTLANLVEISVPDDVYPDNNWRLNNWGHVSPPRYDLWVQKVWDNNSVVVPGGYVGFSIDYSNYGNVETTVRVTDTLPPGLTYSHGWWGSHTPWENEPFPDPTIVGNQLVWDLPEIPVNAGYGFNIQLEIDGGAEPAPALENCVIVAADGPDDNAGDNSDCAQFPINPPGPNLAVNKNHQWNGDGQLGYTIEFANIGDQPVGDVWIVDTLPADTQWDGWWDMDFDWSRLLGGDVMVSADQLMWNFSDLQPGEQGWIQFNANLDNPGEPLRWYTNTVDITIPDGDTDEDNNHDEDVAFSGGEIQWIELDVYGNHFWGYAPWGPLEISTPRETQSWPDGGDFDLYLEQGFLPGDTLTVTAGAGQAPVVFQIPEPFDALGDSDTDQVQGQIDNLDQEWIQVDLDNGPTMPTETDNSGFFDVTFPDIPYGGGGEVRYGTQVDWTDVVYHRRWQTLDLVLEVNYGHDWVEGRYEPGHTVWITATESDGVTVKGTAELTSGFVPFWQGESGFSTNWHGWQQEYVDLEAGDWIFGRVDNGRTAEVRLGTIDGVLDVGADTVDLTFIVPWFGDPLPARCDVWKPNGPGLEFMVDPDGGTHLCDFGPTGWDLQPGDDVGVSYLGPDGHQVYNVFVEPAPYLYVRKSAQGEAGEGGNLAFRIEYGNWGGATAENVTITDALGPGLVYLGDTSGVAHSGSGNGPISWELGDIDPGADSFFDVFVEITVGASDPISNVVFITTTNPFNQSEPEDLESGWEGTVQENDTTVNVGKWAWTDDPAPDHDVIFSVNVCNNGSTGSSEVTLTDDLHPSFSLAEWWSHDSGWQEASSNPQQLVLNRPTVSGFECSEVFLRAHVDPGVQAGESLSNTATIEVANDLETNDNVATWEGQAADPHVNMHVYKWWNGGQLAPGGQLVYHVHVHNVGNVPAGSFTVTDTLPASSTFLESWLNEPDGDVPLAPSAVNGDEVVWAFDGLENGVIIDFDVYLAVDPEAAPGTILTNTVEVSPLPDEDDYEDNRFQDVQTLNPAGPNLRISKRHDWQSPQTLAYTIQFENIGTEDVADFWVTDTLPEGLGWDGWWNTSMEDERQLDFVPLPGSLAWHFGDLQSGEVGFVYFSASMLNAEAPAPVYTNTVEISVPPGDVNPADNVNVDEAVLEVGRLWIEPPSAQIPVGDTVTVDVMVEGISDLYGVAIEIHFDPGLLEVVDADGNASGIQIGPGNCPVPDHVVQNAADNSTGVINYDVISLNPTPACEGGGPVAQITFRALATGNSPVHINSYLLSNTNAEAINVVAEDGAIEVNDLASINGLVELQGRADHSGADVCANDGAGQVICTTTDATGAYELWLPGNTYTVTVTFARYLDGERGGVVAAAGSPVTLAKIKLLGGDANDDCVVNILDLSFMGARYGMSCGDPGWDNRADINNDCTVNILDLSVTGSNYNMTCPVPWP